MVNLMNVLNYIFSSFELDEIINGRFAVVNSKNIDYEQFIRDRLDYLYVEDLNGVVGAKQVLQLVRGQEPLIDCSGNASVVDEDRLDLKIQKPYLVIKRDGNVFGIIDMEQYRLDKKLFSREISGVIREILNSSHDAICVVDDQKRVLH